jgi:murein DD-endopeptidase MepM/ murein hydrolase activator NlpD
MVGVVVNSGFTYPAEGKTVEELREELQSKREGLKKAQEKIEQFKEEIQVKKQEARTLESQISLLDLNIEELELSLDRTLAEIEEAAAEIEAVEAEITLKEEEIGQQKILLGEYIRALHTLDQQSTVSVLLKYASFSEAIGEVATFSELHDRTQHTLTVIQALRNELDAKRRDLEDFRQTLEALRTRQENEQQILSAQKGSKERLLDLTNRQESQFRSLLQQSQAAHQAAETEIKSIDAAIREELKKQGVGELKGVGVMDYPIPTLYGASCVFHCAGYPYAYLIGPHSGIDWPAAPGTPIRAPADGYIAKTHDAKGPGYSYVLMIHGDNLSTVYGHVSGFAVNEGQMVPRGTIIGYTGGAAGTRGAGLSTGPHLHFEVRKNNVPINPQNYL